MSTSVESQLYRADRHRPCVFDAYFTVHSETNATTRGLLRDGLYFARLEPVAFLGVCQGRSGILCPKHERQALLRAAAGHIKEPERPVNRRLLSLRHILDIGFTKRGAEQLGA